MSRMCVSGAIVYVVVAVALAQPYASNDIARIPLSDREMLSELWKAGAYGEYEAKVLAIMEQTKSGLALYEASRYLMMRRKSSSYISDTALVRASEILERRRSEVPDQIKYEIDSFVVDVLAAQGLDKEAAAKATEIRKAWELTTEKVVSMHGIEPARWVIAGDIDRAVEIADQAVLDHPNDFLRNWVVRDEMTRALAVRGKSDLAFGLIDGLFKSWPVESCDRPFLVQNYVEYASTADINDETRLSVLEVAKSAVDGNGDWDRRNVLAPLYYAMAKNYHLLCDGENAMIYYRLAMACTDGDSGELGRNIRGWSERSIARIEAGNYSDVIEERYGDFGDVITAFRDVGAWASVSEAVAMHTGTGEIVEADEEAVGGDAHAADKSPPLVDRSGTDRDSGLGPIVYGLAAAVSLVGVVVWLRWRWRQGRGDGSLPR